jgi:hypothetical protein
MSSNMAVTANYAAPTTVAPTVTVSVTPSTFAVGAAFSVTVAVAGPSGDPTPTGSVVLSSSGFSYPSQTLTNGSMTVNVPAGNWTVAAGTYTLTAAYTPDSNSSSTYSTATGTEQVTVTPAPTTYTLTVDSTGSGGGFPFTDFPADNNGTTSQNTPFTLTYNSGTTVTLTAGLTPGWVFTSWSGCTSVNNNVCTVTLSANTTVTENYTIPATSVLTIDSVNPSSGVTITATPQGSTSTNETTPTTITAATGTVYTLTAPATAGGNNFGSWTGCTSTSGAACEVTLSASMTVTANYLVTPTVTVTPTLTTVGNDEALPVTVAVAGPSGDPTPTGSVTVSYGSSYTSAATTLSSGSATVTIPAGTLTTGSDTVTATYTPDATSAGIYETAMGTSSAVTVEAETTVSVDQSSAGPATTNQILGVNLEAWYDVVANESTVVPPMQTAGMAALRWPGGSWSDAYHWTGANQYISGDASTQPYMCDTGSNNNTEGEFSWAGNTDDAFSDFETDIAQAGSFDLALTANYGSNEACNGGGDPNEAAAWAAAAVADGHPASHITIGNEVYGDWEYDLHTSQHNPTTYADAVIGSSGYYDLIKAQSPTTLVGVVVDANCTTSSGCTDGWDSTVLSDAKGYYDFVEYHYYPEYETATSNTGDTLLVDDYAAPDFTNEINEIKSELTTAGETGTPIYVGEISSNSGDGGTQSWSITQALYAGQILGEAMKDGVSRLTWWDSFDNCEGQNSSSESYLYGWQDWGAQNIFSAGPATDTGCLGGDGAAGTLSPTAYAFQLFSQVAVNGENDLTATVSGDTTDVRAYAATHSGGTALVLFNLNKTTAEPVEITMSSETSSPGIQVTTYDKEIYDYTNVNCEADQTGQTDGNNCTYDPTHNYSSVDWAPPVTTTLGAQTLPYTLVLQPWSMNVVIVQ